MRDSSRFVSVLAERLERGRALLDLGCGPRDQGPVAAHLGLEYAGVDYEGDAAELLVDAHAIPFADGTFDAGLSYFVFGHLYDPALALQEVARVLKSGGTFVGAVSQGEPYHQSYFHMTPWSVLALFTNDDLFEVDRGGSVCFVATRTSAPASPGAAVETA